MKRIAHLITQSVFTVGYINFMKMNMTEYDHVFVILAWNDVKIKEKMLVDREQVLYCTDINELRFRGEILNNVLTGADKIIVSGVFGAETGIFFWPKHMLNKVYLQYWGGDFYQLREKFPIRDIKKKIWRYMLKDVYKRTRGAIFLIEGEYDKYKEITGITKKEVYIAPVPSDPNSEFPFYKYVMPNGHSVVRIVVGNSATEENMHIEALTKLAKFREKNIEVFCPLSYGDKEYGQKIAAYGKKIFGNKFHPILDWMEQSEYYSFLATCDIGIFANNRQQAMGNISALLRMGKKVYLRKDTSMYKNYIKIGCICYDIDYLPEMSYDEFLSNPQYEQTAKKINEWYSIDKIKKQWNKVLEA